MDGIKVHEVRVSAPGKVILHGEHAVVYGKTAIAVSLSLRTSIVVKEINLKEDASLFINFPSVELKEKLELRHIVDKLFDPPTLSRPPTKHSWLEPDKLDHEKHLKNVEDYFHEVMPCFASLKSNQQNSLRGFLYTFTGIFGSTGLPLCSLDIALESELSAGAGTGSSASFAVCLAGAIIQLVKLKCHSKDTEFSTPDKKIISAWAYNCERIMHGSPSGIDNLTCTFGSLISFRKGEEPRTLSLRLALRILLVDTRVSRQTSVIGGKVAAFRAWNTAAVDSVMDACDHVARTAIEILENISESKHNTDVQVQYQRLEELWDMNHCLLAALGTSHPALEDIRRAARAHGFASKLTGAGGGGFAIVLIPPSSEESIVTQLTSQLESLGYRVTDTRLAGPGVRLDVTCTP